MLLDVAQHELRLPRAAEPFHCDSLWRSLSAAHSSQFLTQLFRQLRSFRVGRHGREGYGDASARAHCASGLRRDIAASRVSLDDCSNSPTARNTIHVDVLISHSLVTDLVGDMIAPIVEG